MAKKANIGASIGLDGEKEFRNAVSGINSDMKVLASEMKKVTSEFADNKDGIEALSAKDEVLNKQLDTQREKVDALRKALENSKDQYGENDSKTKGWQTSLNNAEADLNKLNKELKDNKDAMEKAKNPTDDLANEIEDVGKEAKTAEKHIFSMGDMIKANLISEAIIGGVKALGRGMLSLANGVKDAVLETIDYTSEISDMSQKTGIGAEELQKYAYAAKMSGMETETLEKAMIKSQKSFADAKDGSKALQDAYSKLGVDISTISNSEDAFDATLKALAEMDDETTRNALANDLFGKSYAELAPLLNEGADGIDALKAKAEELGIVMSEQAVSSGEALGDTLDTLKEQAGGVANTFISMLLPGLSELATAGTEYVSTFSESIKGANGDIGQIGEVIGATLSDLVLKISDKIPQIMEGAKSLISSFAGGIKDELPTIIETGIEIVMDLVQGLIEALPSIIETGLQMIISLAQGIADSLPELVPAIVDTVLKIVDTILDNIDEIIDVALEIIMALALGLIDALPELAEKIPEIIIKIVDVITNNLPKIMAAALIIIVELAKGLVKAIPELVKSVPKIITAIITGLAEMLPQALKVGKDVIKNIVSGFGNVADVGLNLVKGLWNGINNATSWILDKIRGFGSNVLDGIKDFFGIHSPSTVFEDEVGKNLALGLGKGFTSEMTDITKDINNSIPTDFEINGAYNMRSSVNMDTGTYNAVTMAINDIMVPALERIGVTIKVEPNADGIFKVTRVKAQEYFKMTGRAPYPA